MPILGVVASSTRQGQNVDTGAMFAIQTITISSASATSITFSNIPQTYTHLQLRLSARTTSSPGGTNIPITLQFNNSSVAGQYYDIHYLLADGTSVLGGTASGYGGILFERSTTATAATGTFGMAIVDVLEYTNTNKNKSVRALSGVDVNSDGNVWLTSGTYLQNTAITSLTVATSNGSGGTSGNWAVGSSFALYGIKGA
jgi:hypothetical protein